MVQLPRNFYLKADSMCVTLYRKVERTNKTTGEKFEDTDNIGYYGNLQSALAGWIKHMQLDLIASEEMMELKELLAVSNALYDEAIRTIRSTTFTHPRLKP